MNIRFQKKECAIAASEVLANSKLFIQIKSAWMVAEFRFAYRLLLSDLIDGC